MVKQGATWVYRQYLKDQSLLTLEAEAKAAKRGLWGLPEAERCPPWDWRRGRCATASAPATRAPASPAAAPTAAPPSAASSSGFTCAGKRRCGEMTSCEEAKFYLTVCGIRSLDGDKDGVLCETLCR
jgi:hypothetical protein